MVENHGSRAPDAQDEGETWAPILARAIHDTELSHAAFRLLAIMAELDRRPGRGGVWHTDRQLARHMGRKARSTVQLLLIELETRGYAARTADPNGPGSGRFVRFEFRLARRPENRTPPARNIGHGTAVQVAEGTAGAPAEGAREIGQGGREIGHPPAREIGQGRPRNRAQVSGMSGAIDRHFRHYFEEEKKTPGDGDGRAAGPGAARPPVAGGKARDRAADGPKPTVAAILAGPAEDAARWLIAAEDLAELRATIDGACGDPDATARLARLIGPDLARHEAAKVRLGLVATIGTAGEMPPAGQAPTSDPRAVGDSDPRKYSVGGPNNQQDTASD